MRSFVYRGKRHQSRVSAAAEMLKKTKMTQTAIAKKLGITSQTVNWVNRTQHIRPKHK